LQASGRTASPVSIHLQRKHGVSSRLLSIFTDDFIFILHVAHVE
jgi:hypothetical protein